MSAAPRARRSRTELAALRRPALRTATELFAAGGLEALSLKQVAAVLGVGLSVLYRHFPSRQHLLRAVWDELLAASLREANAAAAAAATPIERPAAFVDGFIGHWLDHPERYLLVFTTGNERLSSQLGFAPYGHQEAVQAHFRTLAMLIEGCSRQPVSEATMAPLLELAFCRSFGLLHPVLYFPSYPWRDVDALRQEIRDELTRAVRRALRVRR